MRFLKFEAEWCQPCKALTKQLEYLGLVAEIIDIDTNKDLVKEYNIRSVPTVVKLDETGKELTRFVGSRSNDALLDFFNHGFRT